MASKHACFHPRCTGVSRRQFLGDMGMGFTSGSGKRVVVSAGALARGAQLLREVEAELRMSYLIVSSAGVSLRFI